MRKFLSQLTYFFQVKLWNVDIRNLSDEDKIRLVDQYVNARIKEETIQESADQVRRKFNMLKKWAKKLDHPSYLSDEVFRDIHMVREYMDDYLAARKEHDRVKEMFRRGDVQATKNSSKEG